VNLARAWIASDTSGGKTLPATPQTSKGKRRAGANLMLMQGASDCNEKAQQGGKGGFSRAENPALTVVST
jgi:hypothetical protein